MAIRPLIIELNRNAAPVGFGALSTAAAAMVNIHPEFTIDPGFAPVRLPWIAPRDPMRPDFDSASRFVMSADPADTTTIVRGTADEALAERLMAHPDVVGVYADVEIQPQAVCPAGAIGNDADVARVLGAAALRNAGLDGQGVRVAIVDTGINTAYLESKGKTVDLDVLRSWAPQSGMTPGQAPVDHGTMCAYDVLIAAPRAKLLDIQLLRSTAGGGFAGFLSDGVRAYDHLLRLMQAPSRPGENRSLVVNNSWGMFQPTWDFPVGNPANYSDNPGHPFNRIVAALEAAGADILFAAGNCGSECPDGRCGNYTSNAIYGANGHPSVLTVAGVSTQRVRLGYSTRGPGRLAHNKPDVSGYTNFLGSGVYAADGGTSAATPVVTGLIAAVRTRRPFQPGNPAAAPSAIRDLVRSTAIDLGAGGFDFDHGFGVVDGAAVARWFPAPAVTASPRPAAAPQHDPIGSGDAGLIPAGTEPPLRVLLQAYISGYREGQRDDGEAITAPVPMAAAEAGCGCADGEEAAGRDVRHADAVA